MRSQKLVHMSVLHALVRHCKADWTGIVCLALCVALVLGKVSYFADQQRIDRDAAESVLETAAYHPVVFLQPDEDDVEEDEEPAPDFFGNWNTTEGKVFGARRFILKQEFQIEIDRINSVCGLEPKQVKKLKIASKGGIKKVLSEWRTKTLTRFGAFNGNQDDESDREPAEEEKYTDLSEIDAQTQQIANNAFFGEVQNETAANSSFWKKTLSSTLSKEQKDVWKDFISEQREAKREAMADATIETLNLKIGLTPEQKGGFTELVRPEILKADLEVVENVGRQHESYLYLYYASKAKNSKMKKILTEAQMQQWKLSISTAKRYGSLFETNNQAGRRNANVWERQGFGLTTLLESAVEIIEEVVEFAGEVFSNQK